MEISLRLDPGRDRHSIEFLSRLDDKECRDVICSALRLYRKGMEISLQLDPERDQDLIGFLTSLQNPEQADVIRQALENYLERKPGLSPPTPPQVLTGQLETAAAQSAPKLRPSNEALAPDVAALGEKLDSMFKF